jgi:hypothetical protein
LALILKLKRSFLSALTECRALYRYSLTPRAFHTDAGVEAAFLQMYKAWESFQEECTLAFMAGRLRADGRSVASDVSTRTEEVARSLIYQERQYVLWTDVDGVIERWNRIFSDPNLLVAAIRPTTTELRQMTVLRNAIAHSSVHAQDKFKDLVQRQFGGRPPIARPSTFLVATYPPDPTRTFFDRYADVLELVGTAIAG